ncbi:MAG: penicillin acylase family protein [Planctomycetota bacterium]
MSPSSNRDLLRRLGSGESIESVRRTLGWSAAAFDDWWRRESQCRAPQMERVVLRGVQDTVEIQRDRWGIPFIRASEKADGWFGFGYAIAQDRLFQLDYLRRKGQGRLAEILGPEGLANDRLARTVGINRIAAESLKELPAATRDHLEWFAAGVNAWIRQAGERLPIEFDLLDYQPSPWSPLDSMSIEVEFQWYLTGRFPVICQPELAKRALGDGPLYEEFCLGEADDESIVPAEAYRELAREIGAAGSGPANVADRVGGTLGAGEATGSNNWVVAGRHTRSGKPMVASDPHIAFEAVSCWYEARIEAGDTHIAGAAYAGIPAIMIGRTPTLAWGITNNICSQRDLYQERTDADHPGCFLFGEQWEPARQLVETITVRGGDDIVLPVRFSRNGPLVDDLLPPPADRTGPVSLRWLGASHGGWLTALLAMNRSRSVDEFREAVRPWHVPTFNLVVADSEGTIAVQTSGRIPLRATAERGYRAGWDPGQQWQGLIPFAAMPHAINPARGWLVSANNRLAAGDYPFPLFGTWISGHRARRIRERLEALIARDAATGAGGSMSLDDFRQIQHDTLSLRAAECLPPLVELLQANLAALSDTRANDPADADNEPAGSQSSSSQSSSSQSSSSQLAGVVGTAGIPPSDAATMQLLQTAVATLRAWDGHVEADSPAPSIFNVFFSKWARAVAGARFEPAAADLCAKQAEGVANRLLAADPLGWFESDSQRRAAAWRAFTVTIAELTQRFGRDVAGWSWGRLHRLPLRHVLSHRGDLGRLLDHGGRAVKGDMITVCNTGSGPDWLANTGAGYRFITDLGTDHVWAVDGQSQSGHANTPHYSDQFAAWEIGEYHGLKLSSRASAEDGTADDLL